MVFFPRARNPHLIKEKNIRQTHIEGQPTKCLTSTLQNYQDHEKQGKTKKVSKPRGN